MNRYRKKIVPALIVAILAAPIIYFFLPGPPVPISWRDGARQMYRIDIRTVMFASYPSIKSIHRDFELHGILNFRIYGIDGETVNVGFQLSNLVVRRGAQTDAAARDLYSGLFFADFSRDGKPLGFKFSNEVAPEDKRILSDIIQSFQLVVHDGFFKRWTTEERNINGTYTAVYSTRDGHIHKYKKKYDALTDITGNAVSDRIEIKNSGITFEYGGPGSWIRRAEGNELIVFYSDAKPYLKVSSIIKLESTGFDPDKRLAIWGEAKTYEDIIDEWEMLPMNKISLGHKSETDALRKKFGDKSFHDVAESLFKKFKDFDVRCIQTLMEFLELNPDAAILFPDYLREKKLNPNQQIMLVHALERIGTEKAQTGLSAIMLGSGFSRESRTQAAIAFGSIGKPSRESIKSLWDAYEDGSRTGGKNPEAVSSTAVLALGSMARKLGSSKERDYIAASESIKRRISADLESKKDLNTTIALLHAAGNTADQDMIDGIAGYFKDENPRVRSAATNSLAYINDRKVNDILIRELKTENDVNVRDSIVKTLYRKEATDETVKTIINQIPSEENEIVRGSMYRYLLKNRDKQGVKDALREMYPNEKSMEHRMIISRALRTKKPASTGRND